MITSIINFFQRLYQDNPSVAAILGVSSTGIATFILYICRSKIQSFFRWVKKQFTTTFLITNDVGTSEVYGLMLKWLKKYNKLYTRSITAPQILEVDELSRDKISNALQYGLGRHLIWFNKRPIWLNIYEEKLENSRERKLYLSMSIIGRNHNLIYNLLDAVYQWNKSEIQEANKDKTRVNIYGYSGIDQWETIRKRGFDTIYLSSKIEADIKHNIQKFLDNEEVYVQHGIPYHYGIILYGPPGTGKTSIIKAIASEFDFEISLIDPLKFDITRLRSKNDGNKIKMLVIEDIDLLLGTKRETVEDIDIDGKEEIEEQKEYDYSIPINILEGNSWEKPFATNEGVNLYIWLSGYQNSTDDIPKTGITFMKSLMAENLYFFDTYKGVNYNKVYKYVSYDENNVYLKEKTDFVQPSIELDNSPKTKVVKSGKDAAGKKVLRELMNAIDGIVTKENFIIIATTNSIESLDPALIRPGRFDTAIKIDYIDMEVFNKAMMRYFGKTVKGTLKKKNLTISKLQVEFLTGKSFDDFVRKYVRDR